MPAPAVTEPQVLEVTLHGKLYRQTPEGIDVFRLVSAKRNEAKWIRLESPSDRLKLAFKRLGWKQP